ncbi:MAG: ASKHA domain-containing protein, partial [Kiritimatiellia bacterium]|nr:ASKHA domain-containing protein [Kiritimatiellia bacterium]
MKRQEHKIIFEPTGRQVYVLPESILLEAAAQAGLILQTPCGGTGKCGKCKVRIISGVCKPSATCLAVLGRENIENGFRLACQAKIGGDLTIEIPTESLFESQQQILVQGAGGRLHLQPAVSKFYIDLGPPDQQTALSDVERIRAAVKPAVFNNISITVIRTLPAALRENKFKGTIVMADHELIGFEPGDTREKRYGVALDLGTTTLVGILVNLNDGADIAVEAEINPQTSYGDDIISRIRFCREDGNGLGQLQRVIVGAMNNIIDKLILEGKIARSDIYEIVIAGNTTMQQIACGINPSALGEMPFVPVFTDALELHASELGLDINPNGRVYIFPQIGGFVGGDTVAGLVASRLIDLDETTLFVDIGTNGEIVLKHKNKIMAASVAAGPAFEGARISCGMRATGGAIEKVLINDDVIFNVIGNTRPAGLCGSAMIDLVAELLRVGAIDRTGRILPPSELPAGLSNALRKRFVEKDDQVGFILAQKSETVSGQPLIITQRDIRELQLATAAIRAGINILLRMERL